MKIVIVCPGWPSVVNPWNGIFVKEQASALAELDADVSVVTARVFKQDARKSQDGRVRVHRFWFPSQQKILAEYEQIPIIRVSFYILSGFLKTVAVCFKDGCDVLHGHFAVPSGFIAALASLFVPAPLIVTVHDSDVQTFPARSKLAAACIRFTLKKARFIVTTNKDLARYVIDHYAFAKQKLRVVPLGVDTRMFRPIVQEQARRQLELPLDRKIAIYVGALLEIKGVDYLLEVAPLVLNRHPDTLFVVIGEGPWRDEMERRIRAGKLSENFKLMGARTHEEIPRWMGAADIFILATRSEGQGMVVHEAVAMGIPVVSSRVGGIPQVIKDGRNGFLTEPGDVASIARRVVEILEDPGFRERSLAGSSLPDEFRGEHAARALLDIFSQVSSG